MEGARWRGLPDDVAMGFPGVGALQSSRIKTALEHGSWNITPHSPFLPQRQTREDIMTIARVTEISATSTQSFDDAVKQGIERAGKTLRNISSAWVKDQNVMVENGKVTAFKVNLLVTFVLED